VFGYEHPKGRVFAFLKYIPAQFRHLFKIGYLENTWKHRNQEVYRAERLYTAENYRIFLETFRSHFPNYVYRCPLRGKEIISVPLNSVRELYVPNERLQRLAGLETRDALQEAALALVNLLSSRSQIGTKDFGIHGSLALGMHTPRSDIDLVVYGGENFRKLETTIDGLVDTGTLNYVCKNRIDAARRHKGKYQDKLFMYGAVRKLEEMNSKYGTHTYLPITQVRFHCKVKDDSEAVFRPAIYKIDDYMPADEASELDEERIPNTVISMIGCYRNVARQGGEIRVSGMLERVENLETGRIFHQVVVGTGASEEEHIWPP
jgi:predicted nucleotidyltransferase